MLGTVASIINFPVIDEALAWPRAKFQIKPRFVTTWVAAAVLAGTASNLILLRSGRRLWLADALVVGGTTLLCLRAFRVALDVPWIAYIKSRTFLIGVLLLLTGEVIVWRQRL